MRPHSEAGHRRPGPRSSLRGSDHRRRNLRRCRSNWQMLVRLVRWHASSDKRPGRHRPRLGKGSLVRVGSRRLNAAHPLACEIAAARSRWVAMFPITYPPPWKCSTRCAGFAPVATTHSPGTSPRVDRRQDRVVRHRPLGSVVRGAQLFDAQLWVQRGRGAHPLHDRLELRRGHRCRPFFAACC